jgi:hypothetical protein
MHKYAVGKNAKYLILKQVAGLHIVRKVLMCMNVGNGRTS